MLSKSINIFQYIENVTYLFKNMTNKNYLINLK